MVKSRSLFADGKEHRARSDPPNQPSSISITSTSRTSILPSVKIPYLRRLDTNDDASGHNKTSLLTLKLSSRSFLDSFVQDDISKHPLYVIKTVGTSTTITRDARDGDFRVADIRWPKMVPIKGKGKDVTDGVLVQMRGGRWQGGETVLKLGSSPNSPRKFTIPNYSQSLKWKRTGSYSYSCTTPSVKGPIASLDLSSSATPTKLTVFETLHDKYDAQMLVHHGVATLLLDYLLITALLLVTDVQDWMVVSKFEGKNILIPNLLDDGTGSSSGNGEGGPRSAPEGSTSGAQWRKIMFGEPLFPKLAGEQLGQGLPKGGLTISPTQGSPVSETSISDPLPATPTSAASPTMPTFVYRHSMDSAYSSEEQLRDYSSNLRTSSLNLSSESSYQSHRASSNPSRSHGPSPLQPSSSNLSQPPYSPFEFARSHSSTSDPIQFDSEEEDIDVEVDPTLDLTTDSHSASRPPSPSAESVFYPLTNASAPSHTYLDPSYYVPPVPSLPSQYRRRSDRERRDGEERSYREESGNRSLQEGRSASVQRREASSLSRPSTPASATSSAGRALPVPPSVRAMSPAAGRASPLSRGALSTTGRTSPMAGPGSPGTTYTSNAHPSTNSNSSPNSNSNTGSLPRPRSTPPRANPARGRDQRPISPDAMSSISMGQEYGSSRRREYSRDYRQQQQQSGQAYIPHPYNQSSLSYSHSAHAHTQSAHSHTHSAHAHTRSQTHSQVSQSYSSRRPNTSAGERSPISPARGRDYNDPPLSPLRRPSDPGYLTRPRTSVSSRPLPQPPPLPRIDSESSYGSGTSSGNNDTATWSGAGTGAGNNAYRLRHAQSHSSLLMRDHHQYAQAQEIVIPEHLSGVPKPLTPKKSGLNLNLKGAAAARGEGERRPPRVQRSLPPTPNPAGMGGFNIASSSRSDLRALASIPSAGVGPHAHYNSNSHNAHSDPHHPLRHKHSEEDIAQWVHMLTSPPGVGLSDLPAVPLGRTSEDLNYEPPPAYSSIDWGGRGRTGDVHQHGNGVGIVSPLERGVEEGGQR